MKKNNYELLKKEATFDNLQILADFWNDILNQNEKVFSKEVLRDLYILNYAPNGMWNYFLSVYYMQNKDENNILDNDKLHIFLRKTIGFVLAYAFTNPGVNALRTPIYAEMINIVEGKEVKFEDFKFDELQVRNIIDNYVFINQRPITKSMLTLWAFLNPKQEILKLVDELQIEHIYATNRHVKEKSLSDEKIVEKLGNKSLLEKDINIRASDYKLVDKKPYYYGTIQRRRKESKKTKIVELLNIADNKEDFTEQDIMDRNDSIVNGFINYLKDNGLIK